MKYKALVFDLDNTIYDYDLCNNYAEKKVFEFLQKQNFFTNFDEFKSSLKKAKKEIKENTLNQAASHNRMLYFQRLMENINIWDSKLCLDLYDCYWNNFLEKTTVFNGFINLLKDANVPKYIITDLTAHIQHRKLVKLGVVNLFNGMLTSEEAGVEKPTPEIFKLALKKYNLNAKEICYIGDSFKKDIEGSYQLGITPYWFTPNQDIENNIQKNEYYYQFNDYKALYEFIK